MSPRLYHCALGLCVLLGFGSSLDVCDSLCGAQAPGDVLIALLNNFHSKVEALDKRTQPEPFNCKEFSLLSFVRLLATVHTINEINRSNFLPGVRLGYISCDTCSCGTRALQITEHLLSINSTAATWCELSGRSPVKAVIGSRYSEISITVAKLLGLYMVPQISTSASADILSDKLRFPSFLRTIPSDVHQTRALAMLMSKFKWNWISVVAGDDDYGKAALQSFLLDAKDAGVCVEFQAVVPHQLENVNSTRKIQEVANMIRSSSAQVVLLILKEELVKPIFKEMITTSTSRIWIASDAWSMARSLASMPSINSVGNIFGFSFITGKIPAFEDFLQNLQSGPGSVDQYVKEYKELRFACTPELLKLRECLANHTPELCPIHEDLSLKSPLACNLSEPQKANDDYLIDSVELISSYGERLAVWAIAHAIKKLLRCNQTVCPGEKDFPPWQLLQELKNINFTLDNRTFYFDKSGNFVNGYDLIHWVRDGDRRNFTVVGGYDPTKGDIELKEINWGTPNNMIPKSKCSTECQPGTMKKISDVSCCYECIKCEEGYFSDEMDMEKCLPCLNNTWSVKGSRYCSPKTDSFFKWDEPYAIALLTSVGIGLLLLAGVLIIFLVGQKSAVVKVAGGNLCFVMLAGLTVSFAAVILFMGHPTWHICRARQVMYGLGFTLCVSCILVKAFRTFLAFLFDLNRQHRLNRFYKPAAIIVLVTVLQGFICMFWLFFDSPWVEPSSMNQNMTVLLQCNEGSGIGFGIMLSYICLLALACFLLAFKARKVPHRFNETGYTIFSMVIYLFVWVCFIPIYVTKMQQRSAVQASAIVVSNFGVIFCHFMPKCYMILCKKEVEISTDAYRKNVHLFSITSTDVALGRLSVDSGNVSVAQMDNDSYSDLVVSSSSINSRDQTVDHPPVKDPYPCIRNRFRRCSI